MRVYLAGPITGLSYQDCIDWRQTAIDYLASHNIQGLSPLRGKTYLENITSISDNYDDHEDSFARALSSQRGIYARDKFDCHRSDLILVNFLGATRVSIGTAMEIAWAAQNNTPIVLLMEKEGNVHEHSMLREACTFRVDKLSEALQLCVTILAPHSQATLHSHYIPMKI